MKKGHMPKVSIIVPVYNAEKYIKRCLDALLRQTLDDLEYILVDDCSEDRSLDILQEIQKQNPDKNIQIIKNERNSGVSHSRNVGLNYANGEFVYFCDNDDWVKPEMLEEMYNFAESRKLDVVLSDMIAVYADHKELIQIVYPNIEKSYAIKQYISSVWNSVCTMLVRRSLYVNHHILFPEGYNMCEDFLVSTKLLLKSSKSQHIEKAYYYYDRSNSASFLHNQNDQSREASVFVNLDLIAFFQKEGCFSFFEKELCWRLLNAKQELIFKTETFEKFKKIFPQSHQYILSCPYLSKKVKITMWTLTHHLGIVAYCAAFCRKIVYSLKR